MCTMSSSVRIDLKRCPCIHSIAQLVDVTLQSLLYQRQLIPEPASTLLHGSSPVAEQFKTTYEKVQAILRNTFRSANGDGCIQEFVILIGGTSFSPKEIYRIRIPVCRRGAKAEELMNEVADEEKQQENGSDGCCCGATTCEELTAKERRLVFSAVALSKTAVAHFEGCKIPAKTDKVFLFIRTKGQLGTSAEGLEEDESFELPDEEMQRRRKIQQLRIQVNAPCCGRKVKVNGCVKENGGSRTDRSGNGSHPHRNGETDEKQNGDGENGHNDYHNGKDEQNGKQHHDNDGEQDGEGEEDAEEGDENVEPMAVWYRLGPFFTNLS